MNKQEAIKVLEIFGAPSPTLDQFVTPDNKKALIEMATKALTGADNVVDRKLPDGAITESGTCHFKETQP